LSAPPSSSRWRVLPRANRAAAQPNDATEKITQLNREALAAVDKREFEKARELLKRALDMCKARRPRAAPGRARGRTSTWG
jgi:hypothetical protein